MSSGAIDNAKQQSRFADSAVAPIAKSLATLRPGEAAVVTGFSGDLTSDPRLLEMGLILGAIVQVVKRAPFGDPIQLFVRGFHLAVSKSVAASIFVRSLSSR